MPPVIRESLDSCRDSADITRPQNGLELLNAAVTSHFRHIHVLYECFYPLRPLQYVKYTATMTYKLTEIGQTEFFG